MSQPSDPEARGVRASEEVEVRSLTDVEELRLCVDLQRRIWGADSGDLVPASVLRWTQTLGGVTAGAFLPDGTLVGFVYGLSGVRDGRLTHWSHMLGVVKPYRRQGIGRRLKQLQARLLEDQGVSEMRWTFDPLVAANAHFNLNGLGVRVEEYISDFYGETGSPLHSFGTDRFVVVWRWAQRSPDGADGSPSGGSASAGSGTESVDLVRVPVANAGPTDRGAPDEAEANLPASWHNPRLRIQLPSDIAEVNRRDPTRAMAWRRSTRNAFLRAFEHGFRLEEFVWMPDSELSCYVLVREPGAAGGGSGSRRPVRHQDRLPK